MGLFDHFSPTARRERALRRAIRKSSDKHALSSERLHALSALRDDGGDDAVLGMLRRFSFSYEKSIQDEQEKEWVYHVLCELGSRRVLPALRLYLKESAAVAWALRVLGEIADLAQLREVLRELCEQNDNGYARDPDKKIQLLHFMGERRDPVVAGLLVPYLQDMNEGVRYRAAEALLAQGGQEALAALRPVLLGQAEESLRIRARIAEGLAQVDAMYPSNE